MAKILDEYRIEATSAGEIIDLRKLSTLDITPLKEFVDSKLKKESEKMRDKLRSEISNEFDAKLSIEKQQIESSLIIKHKDDVAKINEELVLKQAEYNALEKSNKEKFALLEKQQEENLTQAVKNNSLLKDKEVLSKQAELDKLKNQIESEKEKLNSENENKIIREKATLEKVITKLETENESIKKETETVIKAKSKLELVELQSKIKSLEDKIELNSKVFDSTKDKLIAEKNELLLSIDSKVRTATDELHEKIRNLEFENKNSKIKGENFESFIESKLVSMTAINGIDYEKTTNSISSKKPDFKLNYGEYGSIAIECKNSPKFGADWLKTLNMNMGNFKCKYGILIWNSLENKFPIKKEGDIFIVNHEIFEHCLGMIASIMSMESLSDDSDKTDKQLTDIVNWINKNLKVELQSISDYADKAIKNSESIVKNQEEIKKVITKKIFKDCPVK